MIVYHGSYCKVDYQNISFSREALDFGKGFYTTSIKQQAISWTDRFKRKGKDGYLNIYNLQIEETKERYKVKIFESYNIEWLDFILQCRDGSNESMESFYTSKTYTLISKGVSALHCRGNVYLAQELMLEYGLLNHKSYKN